MRRDSVFFENPARTQKRDAVWLFLMMCPNDLAKATRYWSLVLGGETLSVNGQFGVPTFGRIWYQLHAGGFGDGQGS